ncbi:hypothetical protein [Chondrinema litorale]|uniref:hypothetical protein n=1 Tax=Chondrinema litorale TaxID=2994555 RepID=UPI002542AD7B|nr:hypothetical protein [Chondrinema litorale]UZR96873.1 hypothetical protein OQ292_24560 [Chondrinema litorale]UZR98537.1 hypothetical protein OQ292_31535 [Chondrinema litorale]
MKKSWITILSVNYVVLMLVGIFVACSDDSDTLETSGSVSSITSTGTGDVITNLQANGTGGGAAFDGKVNTTSDLDDLVDTAWGEGSLGLHRGHAPIENVLIAFLGISHNNMHTFMENYGYNLAMVCENYDFDPENLIESLTNSFVPFIEEGVENGVISSDEVEYWTEQVREEFSNRVYWEG